MKRKAWFVLLIFSIIATLLGCESNAETTAAPKVYPVKTIEVKNESLPVTLEYAGITGGSEVRKLSFKSTAIIDKIYVQKGQRIKKGDPLVDLDKTDLILAMEAAKYQMDAAAAQYHKAVNGAQKEDIAKAEIAVKNAQDNYNFLKDLYDKNVKLFESGAISKQELDHSKLQLDNAQSSLNIAIQNLQQLKNGTREEDIDALLAQLNSAKTNYSSKESLVQDASLVADIDGYVVDVLGKEGELWPAGNPVILIRSENQVVSVGLSDQDVTKIKVGSKAQVKINGQTTDGEVINIAQMADPETGTYSAEIKLLQPIKNSEYLIGQSVKVYFGIGNKESVWIPISSILNDGEDYVYIVEEGRAVRKNITIGEPHEDKVSVEGLKVGDQLVIEGMKNIKAGYKVQTSEENEK
ncbi:efflux RND transporter periplasmic adaptor subunit [Calidifontibacillus erzurumensis]|uniref:Efflux RND transporter periplasmic adaptor subunit n=1 Tax=Calidifontibacillus erzurumensis TaxID=2741433 RepID=A0A8J8GID7_9BACI|nr:efflux RND transporter periplasmic adaptor subunit [Calidifontibacillus erzurumensis]NSL52923.1 efflux RND transporter periplasmic adaptor subunit [Calidifontibacillus erzurumensis]